MKNLILFVFLFLTSIAYGQKIIKVEEVTDHSSHIIGNNFEGIIFHEDYYEHADDTTERNIKRFTPSNEDIILTESVLKTEGKNKQNKGDRKYIFNNLEKYRRQYIGFFDKKGDKIIYINSFRVDDDWADKKIKIGNGGLEIPTWYNTLFKVFDGGGSFWQIGIDLRKKQIIGMSVNGVA